MQVGPEAWVLEPEAAPGVALAAAALLDGLAGDPLPRALERAIPTEMVAIAGLTNCIVS